MSPSSVRATLVKTELPFSMVSIALGLVFWLVPGATPKKPNSGLTAHSRPSSPTRIQAMSSPRVSTFQPGDGRAQHGEVGLAARRGERRGDELDHALGAGQLEDQHVLGQPALVAGHHAGDPQRVALLAQQRVAAVAGAERPDRPLLGELHDVLGVVARPGDVGLARLQRHPDRVQGGTHARTAASSSSILRSTCGAGAGHHQHRDGDVRRVGELDAEHRVLGLEVAHHERDDVHRAAPHAAGVQARASGPSSRAGPSSCWWARSPSPRPSR